jgi:hypothetical protein
MSATWVRRTDSPALAACLMAIALAVFAVQVIRARGGDLSIFIVAGGPGVDAARVPPGVTVTPGIGGYDGVMFYRLALDPFTHERTAYGITMDAPSYRQQRIGYPLLVWAVTFGRPSAVPAALFAVNFIAIVAMAWTGAALARALAIHSLWGLTFALYPGFLLSLVRDLPEPVAGALALGGVLAAIEGRHWIAALLLSCAALTRETTILFAVALLGVSLYRLFKKQAAAPALSFAVPLVVWLIWQIVLTSWWGVAPVRGGAPAWSVPFVELGRLIGASLTRKTHVQRLYLAECVYVVAIIVLVLIAWRRSKINPEWRLAWCLYLVLGSILQHEVWQEDFGFLRVLSEWFIAGNLILLASTPRIRFAASAATVGLWIYLAHDLVTFLR